MLKEKLNSIPDHISNIHQFNENLEFQQCGHGVLSTEEERIRAWLSPDSLVNSLTGGWVPVGVFLIVDSTTISNLFYNLQSAPKSTIFNIQGKFG